jgi:methylmalonyl-CoA/ethylmalonyl-CoA epimerase
VLVTRTILDHVAIGTRVLTDGWELFGGLLGGAWVYGGDSPGFWWGQVQFRTGPKIELLTPTGGPYSAFLDRFLMSRGPGAHHLSFIVADIGATLPRLQALGIEPVGVSLLSATWKEAFVHPRDAYGIVVQVAQQSGPPPQLDRPAEFPVPGPPSTFALVEHHVADIDSATRLFEEALEGEVTTRCDVAGVAAAELTWHNGARLRLVQADPESDGAGPPRTGELTHLHFDRDGVAFSRADLSQAEYLSSRLGVSLQLHGWTGPGPPPN